MTDTLKTPRKPRPDDAYVEPLPDGTVPKPRRGRPTKLTPEVIHALELAVGLGATQDLACKAAGVSVKSFIGWCHRGHREKTGIFAEFLQRITRAEGNLAVRMLRVIERAGLGDAAACPKCKAHQDDPKRNPPCETKHAPAQWQAAAWKLERRFPALYGRVIQEVAGGLNLHVSPPKIAEDRESRRLLHELLRRGDAARHRGVRPVPGGNGDARI